MEPTPRRTGGVIALAISLALIAGGCVSVVQPTAPPSTPSAAPPTATPAPTAQLYTVRSGDTLGRIATMFDRTIGQLLTANPEITDPNLLRVGQQLVIPPPGAPDRGGDTNGTSDVRDDLLDADGEPMFGEGFADISGLGVRTDGPDLRVELGLVAKPPVRSDPDHEDLIYTVVIDVDDDGQPDYRLKYSNDIEGVDGLAASLEDRGTGQILAGDAFPGEVQTRGAAIIWTVDGDALGGGNRFRLAARIDHSFYPGGRTDPEVETSVDYAPDQQWPQPNPRWVELGAPLASGEPS